MKVSVVAKNIRMSLKKHSPEILTGIGITGMIATTVMAVRATPKALRLIEEMQPETKLDTVKVAWKPYIPAAITGVTSIACLIGANSVNARRNAALAAAYTLSDTALREYKDKVIETIGEKKEQAVRDAVAKDKIEKNPVKSNDVIITEKGNTLCFDTISGRYFKSDIDKLRRIENDLNRRILTEGYISLNDFYYELGLDNIRIGDELGWNFERGLIELEFSSQLASDGTPCLVMNFAVAPKYDF